MAYLTFRVAEQWYGIPVEHVTEVMHFIALDELPLAEPDILGLMTLRDRVITVLDLRRRFGAADTSLHIDTPIIAVQTDQRALGIVVDDVDDVEYISEFAEYDEERASCVSKVTHLSNRLILLLDINRL